MVAKRSFVVPWVIALAAACWLPAQAQVLDKHKDIGGVETAGKTSFDSGSGTYEVTGSGADIWGAEDQFQFAYTELKGDGHVSARILSQEGGSTTGWGRNGLMIRETDAPDSRHLIFCLGSQPATPGGVSPWSSNGDIFSIRRIASGGSDYSFNNTLGDFPNFEQHARHGASGIRELPLWLRVQRRGDLITAYTSPDGKIWSSQIVPQKIGDTPLPGSMLVGIAVSGMSQAVATMKADSVTVGNEVLLDGPANVVAIPSRSDNRVFVTWSAKSNATGYTIYRHEQGTPEFVKAGTTDQTWFIDGGADGQALKAGGNYRYVVTATIPQKVGNDTVPVDTGGSYPARVTPGVIPSPIGPFLTYDIGTAYQGATSLASGVLTMRGAGSGVGNLPGDGGRFLLTEVGGNVVMTARINAAPKGANTDGNIRAGLTVRESLQPGSRMAAIVASSNNNPDDQHAGTQFVFRQSFDNLSTDPEPLGAIEGTAADATKYPLFLRIVRRPIRVSADTDHTRLEGFVSADGKTFTKIGGDEGGVTLSRFPGRAYVGFVVTNQREGGYAEAQFDANSITFE